VIDRSDPEFNSLAVWIDSNHDGRSEPSELKPIREAGVTALSLRYTEGSTRDSHGNIFRYRAAVQGTARIGPFAFDVFLVRPRAVTSEPPTATR